MFLRRNTYDTRTHALLACCPIFKVVYSGATNTSYTTGSNDTNLIISKAEVNEGTTMKKYKPQTRGCSNPIKR